MALRMHHCHDHKIVTKTGCSFDIGISFLIHTKFFMDDKTIIIFFLKKTIIIS